ncbi:hypothetical protein F5890DRAFT_236884 [Lentinula detonsa]|uniref:Uncharacterized protein n=1 Tax=Lentinula detonsa TaxID=2804962 RepID=A0AA38PWD3_9AGAR|nr:hypothetical protein F5890DRAFT_236884 [Lentinula detonsa]
MKIPSFKMSFVTIGLLRCDGAFSIEESMLVMSTITVDIFRGILRSSWAFDRPPYVQVSSNVHSLLLSLSSFVYSPIFCPN